MKYNVGFPGCNESALKTVPQSSCGNPRLCGTHGTSYGFENRAFLPDQISLSTHGTDRAWSLCRREGCKKFTIQRGSSLTLAKIVLEKESIGICMRFLTVTPYYTVYIIYYILRTICNKPSWYDC